MSECGLAYGGMQSIPILAKKTGEYLVGKNWTEEVFNNAITIMKNELELKGDPPGGMPEFRTTLAIRYLVGLYFFELSSIVSSTSFSWL